MALDFSILISSLLGTAFFFLVLAPFVPFFLLVSTFCLLVAAISFVSESSNCMGVMRNDVEGLEDDVSVGCSIGFINVPTFNLSIRRVCELRDVALEMPERAPGNLQNKF